MSLRTQVAKKLEDLANGDISPQVAADWALKAMEGDEPDLRDDAVWRALDRLSGADLRESPGVYLHDSDDFTSWLEDFSITQTE